jgi:D-tyrosyl-tRNA(Tyr) deacylase
MNLCVKDVDAEVLLISQFTLYGDVRRGRRPSFTKAMSPDSARRFFERIVDKFKGAYPRCRTGVFQAMMDIRLVNDGPVTILLDSERLF